MPRKTAKSQKKQHVRFSQTSNRPMGNPQALIAPNEFDIQLKFVDSVTASSVTTYANYVFLPNCPYDVDPAFGSTSTAGYSELAAIYQFQRTVRYSYKITCVPNVASTSYYQYTCINTNVTPPASAYYALAGNQYYQTKTGAPTEISGSLVHFSGSHSVAQIVGSRAPETSDAFASATNSVPSDKIFLGVGVTALTGTTCNFFIQIQLTMHIRFYERKTLST
jgi:hypothetical protein